MKNRNNLSRKVKKYIKEAIDNAGCIDINVLLEDINEDFNKKTQKERESYGFSNDKAIKSLIKTYILGNDIAYADKYGLEEILKWEHLTL